MRHPLLWGVALFLLIGAVIAVVLILVTSGGGSTPAKPDRARVEAFIASFERRSNPQRF